jgi:hypothetical protein
MAIFLSRENWTRGPKDPAEFYGFVWFTDGSGTEEGNEAGIYGLRTKLLFSLGKEICKIRHWKPASL